jgi:hypothetical protein
MNIHLAEPSAGERHARADKDPPRRLFSRSRTVLSKAMTEAQEGWLLDYACSRWESLYGGLGSWRARMTRYERMADDDYSDRRMPDPDVTNATESIFARQNFTLGMPAGFADYVFAQARDEIFGTRPWLAATPQNASAIGLADLITKESQWTEEDGGFHRVFRDSLQRQPVGGTAQPDDANEPNAQRDHERRAGRNEGRAQREHRHQHQPDHLARRGVGEVADHPDENRSGTPGGIRRASPLRQPRSR